MIKKKRRLQSTKEKYSEREENGKILKKNVK